MDFDSVFGYIVIIIALIFYFVPTIIGWEKRNKGGILTLNLFLGWTVIGWIVALVWAMTNDFENNVIIQNNSPKNSNAEELEKLSKLKSDGVLSESEYETEKKKVLSR